MPFSPFKLLPACPNDSVNCLAFSSDTEYLASGGDDGCVYIHTFKLPTSCPLKAEYPTAVTSLRWVPGSHRLFIGLANGTVHLLTIDEGMGRLVDVRVVHASQHDVSSLALNWRQRRLAVASGNSVYVYDVSRMDEGICRQLLTIRGGGCNRLKTGDGPRLDDPWEIQDVYFIDRGSRCLIAYLSFGVRIVNIETFREEEMKCLSTAGHVGACTIDETETYMAIFNIHNGFDFYDIRQDQYLGTIGLEMREAVALPACFLSGCQQVVLGASNGKVKVVALPGLREIETLDHGEDIIQALSHCPTADSPGYIATGCSEKGPETYVKIWKFHQHTMALERVLDNLNSMKYLCLMPFVGSNCTYECAQQHLQSFVLMVLVLLVVWVTGFDYWVAILNTSWSFAGVQLQTIAITSRSVVARAFLGNIFGANGWWRVVEVVEVYLSERLAILSRRLVPEYL